MKNIFFLFSIVSLSGSLQAAELVDSLEPVFQLPCNQGLQRQLGPAVRANNTAASFGLIRAMLNNALETPGIDDDTKTTIIRALATGIFEIPRS